MRLAVYRNGPHGLYFIAQAGLSAHKAEVCRLSPYYVDQVRAMLAGQRYLTERCGDGVAIASGFRAAAVLGAASQALRVAVGGRRS